MTRANATAIVLRADRKPAYATRRTGYVTQELIRQHGSFAKALAEWVVKLLSMFSGCGALDQP